MSCTRDQPVNRLTALILAPVVVLAGIAVFGLVEYRHAIVEEARVEAGQWASEEEAERLLEEIRSAARARPAVRLYREIPAVAEEEASSDTQRLAEASAAKDVGAFESLLDSEEFTSAGLPVRVLAAWRVFELTDAPDDAERLAVLAIHESPSAISAPVVAALVERFPDRGDWTDDWERSEERRAILAAHADRSGLVAMPGGPAFIDGVQVLRPQEVSALLAEARERASVPDWLRLDYVVGNRSVFGTVDAPIATAGRGELAIVAGIGDERALFARYWRVVWWVAALIGCALLTAAAGLWLAQRTLARERRLHELKSQFVASVSHELRAPVASMRLMADALEAEKVNGRKAREFHRLIAQEGARLSALIENVLEFARIDEGRREYAFRETELPSLVRDTLALMEPVAKERGVTLVASLDAQPGVLRLDAAAMQQAVINLLDNAIKFTPRGGTVRVVLSAEVERWELRVADQGPGIAKEERERVFERFIRLENELQRETRGAGIGLSIVKHTVEAHGGTVAIEDNPNGGVTFVVRCGRNAASSAAADAGSHAVRVEAGLETRGALS